MLFEGKEREKTRKVGGARCLGGRFAVLISRRLAVLLARYSVVLSRSQSFPGNRAPPSRLAVQRSRRPVVPQSRGLVVPFFRCSLVLSSFPPFL